MHSLLCLSGPQTSAGLRSCCSVGRQAHTCLQLPSTYQPCATESRATRCSPRPPCAGSRSTAGVGMTSAARSLTSSSQPPLPATTVATTGDSPWRSALEASSSKARISCSAAGSSSSEGNPTSSSLLRRTERADGSSAIPSRFHRQTSPRPSGKGRNGQVMSAMPPPLSSGVSDSPEVPTITTAQPRIPPMERKSRPAVGRSRPDQEGDECDVVLGGALQHAVEQGVAELAERPSGQLFQAAAQPVEAVVEGGAAALDEPVGVEQDDAARILVAGRLGALRGGVDAEHEVPEPSPEHRHLPVGAQQVRRRMTGVGPAHPDAVRSRQALEPG